MGRKVGWGVAVIVILGLILVVGRAAGERVPELLTRVESAGAGAPLLFALIYVVAVVAMIPGSIMTLAAGVLFGVPLGTAIVLVAATVGAVLAFLVGRHVARRHVERRFARDVRFRRIDAAVGRSGLKIVLLLRLTPVLPFNLLNYALGLTQVRLRDFIFGSIGMFPGTLLYVYAGRALGELTAIAAGAPGLRGAGAYIVFGLGFIATFGLAVLLTRLARDALREETAFVDEGDGVITLNGEGSGK